MEFAKSEIVKHYNFTIEYVDKIAYEFERFMELKNLDSECSPSDDIDLLWHQVILDTEFYSNYCTNRFNKIIHHKPQNAIDQEERKIRLNKTIELYKKTFLQCPDEIVWLNTTKINKEPIKEIINKKNNNVKNNENVTLNVIIKHLDGRITNLNICKYDTIYSIKQKIKIKEGFNEDIQRLIYNGTQLQDLLTIHNYNISNNDNIHLILSLKGC
jgi:hypothetical protein